MVTVGYWSDKQWTNISLMIPYSRLLVVIAILNLPLASDYGPLPGLKAKVSGVNIEPTGEQPSHNTHHSIHHSATTRDKLKILEYLDS